MPSSTVGGVSVPRSTPQFNYQTLVFSSNFTGADGTTSAKFTNAALVQAPIKGGNLTFNDDVWLQKPVNGINTITFAPQKTAFISAGVGANNIAADQATMMFVGDNANIPVQGDVTGSNITLDVGNNTVVYNGSAAPTGTLIFNVFYDTTNSGHTGNNNSGNIVLADGATFDLSGVNSIQVLLNAQNNSIGVGSAYPIITSSGGSIIPGSAASLPFNVMANQSGFTRWVINHDAFILYAATADIVPAISRPSIAIHRIINNPNIIIPDIDIIRSNIGGFTPPTPSTGSVIGGVFIPDNPNIPGNNYSPSVGGGGNTPSNPNGPRGYVVSNAPSVGGNTPNGPSIGGSVTNGVYTPANPSSPSNNVVPSTPSIGGNTPSVGTGGSTPSIGRGGNNTPSVGSGGNVGTGSSNPSNYNPSGNSSGGVGTGGNSSAGGNIYSTSTGGTRNNVGGYASSTPATSNGTSSTTTKGSVINGVFTPTNQSSPSNYNQSANSNGGVSSSGSSSARYQSSTGSSYSNPASGGATNSGVSTGGSSYNGSATNGASSGNMGYSSSSQGNSYSTSGATYQPSNNNNGGVSGSSPDISAIGSSRDSSTGINGNGGGGSGGNADSGISRSNANHGFNAAKDNANIGTQEVGKRIDAIKDADGTNPNAEEADSRKRGAAVGGGDCDLDYDSGNKNVYGVWGSPYYGKAVQKALDGLSGYKAKSAGGSVGVDAAINDNIVLGAAYTRIDTKLRYQDAKAGNTTKIETNMASIYGLYNFVNNLFIEGITTYSRSNIKTNELRIAVLGSTQKANNANGKYHSTSYSAQIVGGYNYLWKETSFAPMAGLRLTRIKDSGYQEYGTPFQNLTIKKRQYSKVEGILGGEIKTTFSKNDFIISPQVHAFINYDFNGKTPAIIGNINGISEPLPVPKSKANKMLYDLGAGVVVKRGRMEYGLHYGLNFAKKYHAQSGTLRLKINL